MRKLKHEIVLKRTGRYGDAEVILNDKLIGATEGYNIKSRKIVWRRKNGTKTLYALRKYKRSYLIADTADIIGAFDRTTLLKWHFKSLSDVHLTFHYETPHMYTIIANSQVHGRLRCYDWKINDPVIEVSSLANIDFIIILSAIISYRKATSPLRLFS